MSAQIAFVGNVGRDPESKAAGQRTVVEFSVAVNRRKDEPPTWYRVACWSEWLQDKVLTHVRKGTRVTVFGRFDARPFEQDGVQRLSLDVNAADVQPHSYQDEGGAVSDSDIPF